MRYCDNENAKRLTEKQIELYERLLSYVPAIKEVVKKFDGKVLNSRLDTALKKVYNGASCVKGSITGCWHLCLYDWDDRSINVTHVNPITGTESHSCMYVEYNDICLAVFERDWCVDGRIVADRIIEEINQNAERYEKKVALMKEQLARIDEIIAEYERICDARYRFDRDTNYVIRRYYNLEF